MQAWTPKIYRGKRVFNDLLVTTKNYRYHGGLFGYALSLIGGSSLLSGLRERTLDVSLVGTIPCLSPLIQILTGPALVVIARSK